MVAHGVTRARLPAGNDVVCTLRDPRTADLAARLGTTRSAAALELWRDRLDGAVVAIGNAPTALFHLLEMLAAARRGRRRSSACRSASSARRSRRRRWPSGGHGVPWAVVRGRLGGSAMAAAAVNALARSGAVTGRLIGLGTGPGDPELLTLRAVRALAEADVVAHFAKRGNPGNARAIVAAYLREGVEELPLTYPGHHRDPGGRGRLSLADQRLLRLRCRWRSRSGCRPGRTVVVLSEGDPLFYGSYMHLHVRLAPRYPTEVIPGVTGMSGCWSQAGLPLAQGDDVLTVLPGTLPEGDLARRLGDTGAAVIMKVGRNLAKIRRALKTAGRHEAAVYVERATMAATATLRLADKRDDTAPYFSIVLVPGWEGRR